MAVTTDGFQTVAPTAQTSTDAYATIGAIDTGPWKSLAYTMKVATFAITWTVYGANLADYSDETVVQAEANVAVGTVGTYVVAQAPFRYYRAKIKSTVGGSHGVATFVGIAKP